MNDTKNYRYQKKVKRNGINRNLSNYSIKSEKRAVDKKAEWIRKDYILKCKQCDVKYAVDTSDSGPFLTALESFEGGGIFPIAIGAFGETNKEMDKFLQRCARLASARQEGVSLSPLAQQNSKNSSYSIIISKFRKVLGCVAMKVNLDIRHRRLQFVQRSREGARRAAAEQRNRRTGTFNHENGAWFNMQEEESTYAEYCRYRNAHRYDDARNNTFGRRNE